jgi:hypothetical protein
VELCNEDGCKVSSPRSVGGKGRQDTTSRPHAPETAMPGGSRTPGRARMALPAAPASSGARECPRALGAGGMPTRSESVGQTSRRDTGVRSSWPGAMPGPAKIRGTREDGSRRVSLYTCTGGRGAGVSVTHASRTARTLKAEAAHIFAARAHRVHRSTTQDSICCLYPSHAPAVPQAPSPRDLTKTRQLCCLHAEMSLHRQTNSNRYARGSVMKKTSAGSEKRT